MELMLVLKGSVEVGVGKESHLLKTGELFLVKSPTLHITKTTEKNNVILTLKIDPDFYNEVLSGFNALKFKRSFFLNDPINKEAKNKVKHYMAKIVFTLNNKEKEYELKARSYLYLLG